MNYLLYGENETEMEKFIEKLIKDQNIENKIVYNYKECKIEDVLEEAGYQDLFGEKKLIILNEADFLTTKSTLENPSLEEYIKDPNPNTILIFKIITEKLDERKKLVKFLKQEVTVKEFKLIDESDLNSYIKKYFEENNYTASFKAINEIVERLKSNTKVIDKELDKLILYKLEEKNIDVEDVKKVITKYAENEIFDLVEAVIKKDKQRVFTLYKKLIDNKEEPAVIITLLANQFRLMYQAKILAESDLDSKTIASKLGIHPYRVTLALKESNNMKESEILKMLENLYDVDKNIKLGLIEKTKALEAFFLEL